VYPPRYISFAVGATPQTLCAVPGGPHPVRATNRWQVRRLHNR